MQPHHHSLKPARDIEGRAVYVSVLMTLASAVFSKDLELTPFFAMECRKSEALCGRKTALESLRILTLQTNLRAKEFGEGGEQHCHDKPQSESKNQNVKMKQRSQDISLAPCLSFIMSTVACEAHKEMNRREFLLGAARLFEAQSHLKLTC